MSILSSFGQSSHPTIYATDGNEIIYTDEGKGTRAIVFVHGWAGNKEEWKCQLEAFSKSTRAVALDLPGFGKSGHKRSVWSIENFATDVVSLVTTLDLDQIILVGHSMGAAVIMETAKKIPDRVIAIVPVDMFQNVEVKRSQEEIDSFIRNAMSLANDPSLEKLRPLFKRQVSDSLLIKIVNDYRGSAKVGWRESLHSHFQWMANDLLPSLSTIQVPIVCINSDRGPSNIQMARKYAKSFNVLLIRGVGHAIAVEAPDEFNSGLSTVLAILDSSK